METSDFQLVFSNEETIELVVLLVVDLKVVNELDRSAVNDMVSE